MPPTKKAAESEQQATAQQSQSGAQVQQQSQAEEQARQRQQQNQESQTQQRPQTAEAAGKDKQSDEKPYTPGYDNKYGKVGSLELGDVVIVKVDPRSNNGADVAPALVVRVLDTENETRANLRVLSDDDATRLMRNVLVVDKEPEDNDEDAPKVFAVTRS